MSDTPTVEYWIQRAFEAEDRAGALDLKIADLLVNGDSRVQEADRADEAYDDLYDELTEEWIRNDDLKEELDRARDAYEGLVDLIVLFEPSLRKVVADESDALQEKFEEFAHELHRSLIARSY